MISLTVLLTALTTVTASPVRYASSPDRVLQYQGFSLQFNCAGRTADRYAYTLSEDHGSSKRPKRFTDDPNLDPKCQQLSTRGYGSGYDRGHLVTSNHMDSDSMTIKQSHYMTNVVPQVQSFNQGIWVRGEAMAECYRDLNPVHIYGGVVYTDSSNDIFLESHGIKTPDFFWKVMVTKMNGRDEVLSWYIPNTETANDYPLENYIVSVRDIERKLNDGLGPIPVAEDLKDIVPRSNWRSLRNCDAR